MGELVVVSGFVDSEGFFVGIAEELVDIAKLFVDNALFVDSARFIVGSCLRFVDIESLFVGIAQQLVGSANLFVDNTSIVD